MENLDKEGLTTGEGTGPEIVTDEMCGEKKIPTNAEAEAATKDGCDGVSDSNVVDIPEHNEERRNEEIVEVARQEASKKGDCNIVEDTKEEKCQSDEKIAETPCTREPESQVTGVSELTAPDLSVKSKVSAGLSLLAEYDSDSEDTDKLDADVSDVESVLEVVPSTSNTEYRAHIVEVSSEDDEEHSSSSSTDSSDDSDVECLTKLRKKIDKAIKKETENVDEDDEDDDNGVQKGGRRKPPKVKGELLLEDLPPIQDLHITVPEDECVELGRIKSIVDQLVLVSALPNALLVDLDSVLFLEKGQKVLGEVFDVLGQVSDPLYCVRFNSNEQIKEKGIKVGDVVYMAPKTKYTQYIILSNLMKMRGSDASWEDDVEPPPRFLDYSDDEEEREARARLRNKDRANRSVDGEESTKRARNTEGTGNDGNASIAATSTQQAYRGRRGNRGLGGNYRPRHPYQQGPSPNQYQHPPIQRPPNHNPSSWHSNYYPPPYYAPQPQQQHMGYSALYGGPGLMSNIMHYPPPDMNQPTSPLPRHLPPQRMPYGPHAPPGYVLNPYAVRPPVLRQQPEDRDPPVVKRENV